MVKILFIAPHLSTGGMPQYLYKQMESIINDADVYCIEWDNITGGQLVIQRNRIQKLLGNKLITLGENKTKLFEYINDIKPDVIHLQEIPEYFISYDISKKLYSKDREYTIIETSHDSSGDPRKKLFFPDKFMFVSKWQIEIYKSLNIPSILVEYPIEYVERTKTREELCELLRIDPKKKHIINVGLFTPRKNQAEVIEYARMLSDYPIQFHFIGNQADNFKTYWEPLLKNLPKNCKIWGERNDVETFYQMADLMLFTSRGSNNDKETSPLVIREAISNRTPSLIYNLPVYLGMYDNYDNLKFLDFDNKKDNANKILKELGFEPIYDDTVEVSDDDEDIMEVVEIVPDATKHFYYETTKGKEDLLSYEYPNSCQQTLEKYGEGAAQYWSIFLFKEMDNNFIKIEPGDVFFDLGSNIGMSSKYALMQGASEVHCFEPDPKLHYLIRKNIPEATIYDNAIDKDEKEIELYHWPYNPVSIGPKYRCRTVNLNTILKITEKPINYMKIDIEGFEEHLFDNVTKAEMSKVDKLFVECHFKDTDQFCRTLASKGFDLYVDDTGLQTYVYAKSNQEYIPSTDRNLTTIKSVLPKKIHIIDAYATTPIKLNILRQCISSVKKMGGDIMLVSHCSFPQDIVDSVQYHIFDADNRFNACDLIAYRVDNEVEIEYNINEGHTFPVIKSIRLGLEMAQQLKYEYFQFTEFDHIYSEEDIVEIINLENQLLTNGNDFLFFKPLIAHFDMTVGEFYESCFFMGSIEKFINKFNGYFPETLEEFNNNFALKLPNNLEYYFYSMFKDENCLIIEDFVKSYFKTSEINLSSNTGIISRILIDGDDVPYLAIINCNSIDYRFEIDINGEMEYALLNNSYKIIQLTESSRIQINVISKDNVTETINLIYDKNTHENYKKYGYIKHKTTSTSRKLLPSKKEKIFKVKYEKNDNKLTFNYVGKKTKNVLVSVKDIDSRACIFSAEWEFNSGSEFWMIPLPKNVIDFYNDPQFGGFSIEFRENDVLIETQDMWFKTLSYTKPVMDLTNTEPIFMNYREFFDEGIYDEMDISNCDVVFDIGANIGLWTAYILEKGAKKVYAFEPNKLAVNQLENNFKDNENVVIVPNGIYHKHTKIPFYVDEGNSLISSVVNGDNKVLAYEIDTVTIDEMISKYNIDKIDLLKMDIEGAEFDIFDNISAKTMSKINSLLIEYHEFYFGDGMDRVDNLIYQLENFGYDVTKPYGTRYVFATRAKKKIKKIENKYGIGSRWDNTNQTMYFQSNVAIDFPLTISIKEYASKSVLWSEKFDNLPKNIEFWICPINKSIQDYETIEYFYGVTLGIYKADTDETIFEQSFPNEKEPEKVKLNGFSNVVTYFMHHMDYFVDKIYDDFFADKKFKNVVDAGANIGVFTDYILSNDISKEIIAIECDQIAQKDLRRNYKGNKFVTIVPKALHYNNEPITFYESINSPAVSTTLPLEKLVHYLPGNMARKETVVETITIKELIEEYGTIDLLKLDIEGGEYDIIENLNPFLFEFINNIFIECHFFEKDWETKYKSLVNKIKDNGYIVTEPELDISSYIGSGNAAIFATKIKKQ